MLNSLFWLSVCSCAQRYRGRLQLCVAGQCQEWTLHDVISDRCLWGLVVVVVVCRLFVVVCRCPSFVVVVPRRLLLPSLVLLFLPLLWLFLVLFVVVVVVFVAVVGRRCSWLLLLVVAVVVAVPGLWRASSD